MCYKYFSKYFLHTKRVTNIIYTKIIIELFTEYDLHREYVIDSQNCSCEKKKDSDLYNFLFLFFHISKDFGMHEKLIQKHNRVLLKYRFYFGVTVTYNF